MCFIHLYHDSTDRALSFFIMYTHLHTFFYNADHVFIDVALSLFLTYAHNTYTYTHTHTHTHAHACTHTHIHTHTRTHKTDREVLSFKNLTQKPLPDDSPTWLHLHCE